MSVYQMINTIYYLHRQLNPTTFASKNNMKQAIKKNSNNELAQDLIIKIRLAVAMGHLEMLPELNSKLIQLL